MAAVLVMTRIDGNDLEAQCAGIGAADTQSLQQRPDSAPHLDVWTRRQPRERRVSSIEADLTHRLDAW